MSIDQARSRTADGEGPRRPFGMAHPSAGTSVP